jgi:methylase of polypeptide subunit release factors
MTLRDAMKQAAATLAAAPATAEFAAQDAALLMMHLLSVGRAELLAYPERELSDAQHARYIEMVRERAAAKPVQYIVG